MLSFEGTPFTQELKILSRYIRLLGAAHSEDFVILVLHHFDTIQQCDEQMEWWTDVRTDAQAMAKTREAFCCRA